MVQLELNPMTEENLARLHAAFGLLSQTQVDDCRSATEV